MAGNTEIFDEIVAPSVKQQLQDTADGLAALDKAFIQAANSANQLNEATASSKSPAQFKANAEASNAATQKIIENNEKARLSDIKLQQQREKAFDDYEKKLAKQASDQQKAQAQSDAIVQKQLANQAKIDAATAKAAQPIEQLKKAYADSRTETENLAVSQGRLSQAYLDSNEKTKGLKSELDAIKQGYGDNTGSVGKYENALNRLGGILTSRVFRLAGTFLITDLIIKGTEALFKYIAALNIFNPIASAAEQAQKALDETFKSADYTKGIEGLEKLQSTLDLQKTGFASADDVINQYNETIGKAYGQVDTLTQAQQGFINLSKDYIRSIELEAAANILLGQTSAFTADILTKNQKLQDDIDNKSKARADFEKTKTTNPDYYNDQKKSVETSIANSIAADKADIAENLKREQDYYDNSLKALDNFYTQRSDLSKKNGVAPGGNTGNDPIAALRNTVANQQLEIDKQRQQAIIDNEKKSFDVRIAAVKQFGEDEKEIADNNSKASVAGRKLSALQQEQIANDLSIKETEIANSTAKKIQELEKARDEKRKADFNNQLKIIKDNEALILDNDKSTYQQRIDAIAEFQTKSTNLISKGKKSGIITGSDADSLNGGVTKDVLTQTQQAQDKLNEILRKSLDDQLKDDQTTADKAVRVIQEANDKKLQSYEDERLGQSEIADKLYSQGKISEQKYRNDLLLIEDEYNIKRYQKQLDTDKSILEVRQSEYRTALNTVQDNDDAVPEPVKNNLKTAQSAVTGDQRNLTGAQNKYGKDQNDIAHQLTDGQKESIEIIGDVQKLQEDGSKIIEAGYQRQIDLLEQRKVLIENSANAEIEGINNSILSAKDKQNKINIINKQTAIAEQQLQAQENQIKKKQAKEERIAAIANLAEATAVAEIQAYAQTGPIAGTAFAIIIAALAAAELAAMLATPLPSYKDGTKYHKGGYALWGHGVEMATEPGGKQYLSPDTETLASFPVGTVITPHKDLLRMVKPDNISYTGREQIGWREVVAAIDRQKHPEQKRPYVNVNVYPDRSGYLRR